MVSNLPERRLIAAVLRRAIRDICGHGDVQLLGPESEAALMEWVLLADEDEAYSFRWCCRELNLPADKVGGWFVTVARIRKVKLPREPWGIRVNEGKIESVSARLGEDLWRSLREAGHGFYDGDDPQ